MNKEELLNLVDSLHLPTGEYYILGGGSLVVCGLREKTADLDLSVSYSLFEVLKKKYNLTDKDKNDCGFYKINDKIEIVPNNKSDFTMQNIDGYYIESLSRILNFKKSRNLPKDQNDIKNIENYLLNNSEQI